MAVDKEEVRKLVIPAENGANNLSFCSAEDARNIVAVGGPTNIGIKSLQFNVSYRPTISRTASQLFLALSSAGERCIRVDGNICRTYFQCVRVRIREYSLVP